jgi:hypothetical protein
MRFKFESYCDGVCDFRLRLGTAKYKYYVAFHSLTIRHTFIISHVTGAVCYFWTARVEKAKA